MTEFNSSVETLTANMQNENHELAKVEIGDEKVKSEKAEEQPPSKGKFAEFREQYSKQIKTTIYIVLNVVFIVYFAFATKYWIDNDGTDFAPCNGYGLLVIIGTVIYVGMCYSHVFKPYILPSLRTAFLDRLCEILGAWWQRRLIKIIVYLAILAVIAVYLILDTADDRTRLTPLLGLATFLCLGFATSANPRKINWQPVIWGLLIQFCFGLLTIRWTVGRNVFLCLGDKVATYLSFANNGSTFVYGDFLVGEKHVFVFTALSVIYFLSFTINILYHLGVMQHVIAGLGTFLASVMGTSICESVNSAANIFLGMTEAPLLLKPYLMNLTKSELHAIMTAGFATVSGSVLAAYISFGAKPSYLITASVMAAPAALCFSKLNCPETEQTRTTKESIQLTKSDYTSILDAASKGASAAIEIVLGIVANLIAFIAFIAFINSFLAWVGYLIGFDGSDGTIVWGLQTFMAYFFKPIAWLLGVPWEHCETVGRLISIKSTINEFAAYEELGKVLEANPNLPARTEAIATFALCGFANPGAIGIMIGVLGTIVPNQRSVITSLAFRAFFSGTCVNFMTACIASMLMSADQ